MLLKNTVKLVTFLLLVSSTLVIIYYNKVCFNGFCCYYCFLEHVSFLFLSHLYAAAWEPSEARELVVFCMEAFRDILRGFFFSLLYRPTHTWHMVACKSGHMCVMHGACCEEIHCSDKLSEVNIEACY